MKRYEDIPKNQGSATYDMVAEDNGIAIGRGSFIPGRFYQFQVDPGVNNINEEIILELNDGRPYYDTKPIGLVFYHDQWQKTALILNLKVIPQSISEALLHGYYNFASKNGLTDLFDKEDNLIPLSERRLIDKRFYMVTPAMLADMLRIRSIQYAINKYNMESILEAKLIDWDKVRFIQKKVGFK